MTKIVRSCLIGLCLVSAVVITVQSVQGQCGTYFTPGYRAVGKIGPGAFFGSPFTLNDWTGDGRLDFWNFRQATVTSPVEIIIYPALPTGYWNWDAPIIYTTGIASGAHTGTLSPVLRDFDGDSRTDLLLVTNQGGVRTRQIHRNVGNGTLQPMAPNTEPFLGSGRFPRHLAFEDINGDSRLDWLYYVDDISGSNDSINYALQNADGAFGPFTTVIAETPENEVNNSVRAAGDFDGDGMVDLAYLSTTSPDRRIRLLKNDGTATFTLGPPQAMASQTAGNAVYDFNGDGRKDILTWGTGQFVVYFGQSNGTFTSTVVAATGAPTAPALRVADMNGDGRPDVVNLLDQSYQVFISSTSGGFETNTYARRIYPSTFDFILSDFTGDGKADLWDSSHQTLNAFFEEVVTISTNVCQPRGMTRAMNYDNGTAFDIATWSGATGEWRTSNGDWPGNGVLTTRSFYWGSGSLGDIPAPGDYDGDGRSDHAVYRNSEGKWYVFLSGNSSWFVMPFGLPGDIPIPNDYDGGGKTDIAVFRPSDGNWYIWSSENQSFAAINWGTNGDRPVPADFDGDGRTDVAIWRPSTGVWYYIRSSDSAYRIIHWGTVGDVAIPGDYDGDGRADLTVYREGVWHILRSSNDQYGVRYWGTAGDVPIPFLERGEIASPLVYRPSRSQWYNPRHQVGVMVTPSGTPVKFGLPN